MKLKETAIAVMGLTGCAESSEPMESDMPLHGQRAEWPGDGKWRKVRSSGHFHYSFHEGTLLCRNWVGELPEEGDRVLVKGGLGWLNGLGVLHDPTNKDGGPRAKGLTDCEVLALEKVEDEPKGQPAVETTPSGRSQGKFLRPETANTPGIDYRELGYAAEDLMEDAVDEMR